MLVTFGPKLAGANAANRGAEYTKQTENRATHSFKRTDA